MSALDVQNAIAFLEQGRSKDAVQLLRRLTDAMPVYTTAFVLLARAYEAEGAWHDALVAWQRAQLLMPNSPSIRDGLRRVTGRLASAPGDETPDEAPPPPAEEAPRPEAADEGPGAASPLPEVAVAQPDEAPAPDADAPADEPAAPAEPEPQPEREPPPTRPTWRSTRERQRTEDEGDGEGEDAADRADLEASAPNVEDLDRLIDELESARIVPRPDIDVIPTPDLEDEIEDVVSETLARIYTAQQQYGEAARAYEALAEQHPERADEFRRKAAAMRAKEEEE